MDPNVLEADMPYSRMVAIGMAINSVIWLIDGLVPERLHGRPGYRRIKALLAPALGALVGLIPDLLSSGHWVDRMIFGAMVGGSSTAAHNGIKRRAPREVQPATTQEVPSR